MIIETELKYLINRLPSDLPFAHYIEQRYFDRRGVEDILKKMFNLESLDNISTTRIRSIKHEDISYIITLKTKGLYSRYEYEKLLTKKEYEVFLNQPITSCIIKNRYIINKGEFNFEFDEYLNLKNKLYTVEIEVDNIENSRQKIEQILSNDFSLKYEDVTLDFRYKNSNLQKYF